MADSERNPSILRVLFAVGRDAGSSDAQLLELFVDSGDDNAFELLMWRHSQMVLRTCKAVLHDHHAAEDVTQAVFLKLARHAKQIRNRESILGWLYRTAYHLALSQARKDNRVKVAAVELNELTDGKGRDDQQSNFMIHQEIAGLPEKYRLPILLCYFEGLSRLTAAERLGWPSGTLDTRISKAKEILKRNLTRRGLTITASGLAAALTMDSSSQASPEFIKATLKAVIAIRAGAPVMGISANALRIADEAILTGRSVWLTTGIIACVATAIGGTLLLGSMFRPEDDATKPEDRKDAVRLSPPPSLEGTTRKQEPRKTAFAPKESENHIDAATISAFRKLGAEYTSTSFDRNNYSIETIKKIMPEEGVPTFLWRSLPQGKLPELPHVDAKFGISLIDCKVRDSGIASLMQSSRSLVMLELSNTGTSDEGLKVIAGLKELQYLSLDGTYVTDRGLDQLANLENLEYLELSGTAVTDVGMSMIPKLKKLRMLSLRKTSISDDGLERLAENKNIEILFLNKTLITERGISRLVDLPKLQALYVSETAIDDDAVESFTRMKELRFLDLMGTTVDDQGVAVLSACPRLEGINLKRTKVSGDCLKSLSRNLKDLSLSEIEFSPESFREISAFTRLESLDLSSSSLRDDDLHRLGTLKKLRLLNLAFAKISDAGIPALLDLENLEVLNLNKTYITDQAIARLAGLKKLYSLGLAYTKLTDVGLKELNSLPELCELRIEGTSVTEHGLTSLKEMPRLKKINIEGTRITRQQLEKFWRMK